MARCTLLRRPRAQRAFRHSAQCIMSACRYPLVVQRSVPGKGYEEKTQKTQKTNWESWKEGKRDQRNVVEEESTDKFDVF